VNSGIIEKLRGKKRSVVSQVVSKLMQRARMSPLVSDEIAEMVHEDLLQQISSGELALQCELILSLFTLIEALCKRFGEAHLELRQDDYAVVRVVPNDRYRIKEANEQQLICDSVVEFSSIVEFVDKCEVMSRCTSSCHFLSARLSPIGKIHAPFRLQMFHFSKKTAKLERLPKFG